MRKVFALVCFFIIFFILGCSATKEIKPKSQVKPSEASSLKVTTNFNLVQTKSWEIQFNPKLSQGDKEDGVLLEILILNLKGLNEPFRITGTLTFVGDSGRIYYWNKVEKPGQPFNLEELVDFHKKLQSLGSSTTWAI